MLCLSIWAGITPLQWLISYILGKKMLDVYKYGFCQYKLELFFKLFESN